jgi:cation-transporting P-type ATPase F
LGRKAGLHRNIEEELRPTIDVIPFSSDDQYMATRHREGNKQRIYVKGSVEAVLTRCTGVMRADGTLDALRAEAIHAEVRSMSEQGLRVLAMATAAASTPASTLTRSDLHDMAFTGLVAMVDPPRDEARQAIAVCQQAGVRAVMITGDHAATAATIASQLGIRGECNGDRLRACTGQELATMNSEEFALAARNVSVFARVTPEQKLRLVESLQYQGNIVAMTGDGVNDAPALKQADIGVAMGKTGTDVAKDASDMVLTDDNFATIVHAVEEGRTVFDNLLKFIVWTIPTNIGEGLVIVVAIALGTELPIEPVQILWINMTTAIILGLPLAFEPNQPDVMTRHPRNSKAPILGKDLLLRTLFVGLLLLGFSFALFQFELGRGLGLTTARTTAANAFVLMGMFYLFACRTLTIPKKRIGWFTNPWVWGGAGLMLALQVMFAHVPFMNWAFKTAPVSIESWALAMCAGVAVLILVTLEKHVRARLTRSA